MSRIVITGAGGFIGRAATRALAGAGYDVRPILRKGGEDAWLPAGTRAVHVSDLADNAALLGEIFGGAAMVVHLADNPQRSQTGETGSLALAQAVGHSAEQACVPRFVFASSIYASLDEQGAPNAYGAGKRAAEVALSANAAFQTVSLRFPPVYGPGSKGAISLLAGLVRRGIPVPFGAATAPRDYLAIGNLVELLAALAGAGDPAFTALAGRAWEPCDGAPLATRALVKQIGEALGRPGRLVAIPQPLLSIPAALSGKHDQVEAAFAPLRCADGRALSEGLDWQPSSDWAKNLGYLAKIDRATI